MHDLIHHTRPNGEAYPMEDCRIYQAFREGVGMHVGDEIVWRADGTSFPAEYWSHPVELHDELVGCVVAFVDISDRQSAEEELRQSEKLAALGKLSAGLAHELNNPAAAAQRAAAQMGPPLAELEQLACRLGQRALDDADWDALRELRERLTNARRTSELQPLERADQEDEVVAWLEDHEVTDAWALAAPLGSLAPDALDDVAGRLAPETVGDALRWVAQSATAQELLDTITASTGSISRLVGAVKTYSAMDRAPEQEIDIHEGLEATLLILAYKTKQGTRIVPQYDRSLPHLLTRPGELNQVWTNLLDNAIDAAGPSGEVRIRTFREADTLIVEVADNGPGIPAEIQAQIFDPFFTTKDVGAGSGLGLDIVRRIVNERCGGEVTFESQPGDTRFRVRLPLAGAPA
jgi:signal transduction histidine kinase